MPGTSSAAVRREEGDGGEGGGAKCYPPMSRLSIGIPILPCGQQQSIEMEYAIGGKVLWHCSQVLGLSLWGFLGG